MTKMTTMTLTTLMTLIAPIGTLAFSSNVNLERISYLHPQAQRSSSFSSSPRSSLGSNSIFSSRYSGSSSSSSSLQCICINCSRVTDCKAYHFVESKHEQPHMSEDPQFTPQDGSPTIHVNIRNMRNNESEMARLWAEHVEQTKLAEEKNLEGNGDENSTSSDETDEKLMGEEQYDLSVQTTYEYDVVECEDYVEDLGCWVRNMPEEIRLANPDFVPT